MKNSILALIVALISFPLLGQTQIVKNLPVESADKVNLEFKFANQVTISTWDREEVALSASVRIGDGRYEDLYKIEAIRNGNTLEFYSNGDELAEKWQTLYNSDDCCRGHGTFMEINIEVQMPAELDLEFNSISGDIIAKSLTGELHLNTISGDITVNARERPLYAKSISGDVELLVKGPIAADFQAKTISGEIYSNLDFEYLDKKEGLRQIVGQKVRGRLNEGGQKWELETISGNIFLRGV